MKKTLLIPILFLVCFLDAEAQTIPISDARAGGANKTVSIAGTIINGTELDPVIRYIQDETGGFAIYSSAYASQMSRGDHVIVTGTVKDYNNLYEIDPVSVFSKVSSGNTLPEPVLLTPGQWSDVYEGMLVKIEGAVFSTGGVFAGKTNYTITAGGQTGQIRITTTGSPLVGQVIPTEPVTLIGILSQYTSTYQLLLRDVNDIITSKNINLRSAVSVSNISSSGFTLNWKTDVAGSSEVKYGLTPNMELGYLPDQGPLVDHTFTISGLNPSEFYYIQPFSVAAGDTVKSPAGIYITGSLSSGSMKTYFNRTPDKSFSIGTDAIQLDHAIDDTLISYINRAKESIDFTIYNFNNAGISNISNALNAAYSRGVKIRVIYDGNTNNAGIDELNAEIGRIASPVSAYPFYGIMHNKFVIFDAYSADPNDPIVWTGSTNFTDGQINTDPNNVIIIQDQSLAKSYVLEFNEMFGSDALQPVPANSKFGPDKVDNTPHFFSIGGHEVESYFSPSDGVNARILENIKASDYQLYIATMLITRTELGYEIRNRKNAGADAKVLLNNIDESTPSSVTVSTTLQSSLGGDFVTTGESGIMHHKYLVSDPNHADSDPLVLTGSHNWSSSAEDRNDENTLVIHSQEIANQYQQDFMGRFKNGVIVADAPVCVNDYYTLSSTTDVTYEVTGNDAIPSLSNLTILSQPSNGTAIVMGNSGINYTPDADFRYGLDTVVYKLCLASNGSLCGEAKFIIFVNLPNIVENSIIDYLQVYPNPAKEKLNVNSSRTVVKVEIMDLTGRSLFINNPHTNKFELQLPSSKGIYFLRFKVDNGETILQKIVTE